MKSENAIEPDTIIVLYCIVLNVLYYFILF